MKNRIATTLSYIIYPAVPGSGVGAMLSANFATGLQGLKIPMMSSYTKSVRSLLLPSFTILIVYHKSVLG